MAVTSGICSGWMSTFHHSAVSVTVGASDSRGKPWYLSEAGLHGLRSEGPEIDDW